MQLILIRHPAPDIASGLCYGRSDVPVAPQELTRVRVSLQNSLPRQVPVYSSPLSRCLDLASLLAHDLNAGTVRIDARLMEMDFGAWEMQTWHDIERSAIDAWAADLVHYRPGNGENVLTMATRVQSFLQHLLREQHGSVIVVCHAGTIRLITALQSACSLEKAALMAASSAHKIAYGSSMIIDF